jgi:two-component system, OmpR family, sensor kinase
MAIRDLLRGRLALRIYIVGLAQMAVVAAGFFILILSNRPPGHGPIQAEVRHIARHVAASLDDPDALQRELRWVQEDFRSPAAVFDASGGVIASSPGIDIESLAAACAEDRADRAERPEWRCVTAPIRFPDGRDGRLVFAPPGPPPPPPFGTRIVPLVLVVVAVSSLLLARSLTRPLRRLSTAARAFGGGDLAVRVGLGRQDELGDVSRAFDEMAERVSALLRAEKELLANVSHELRTPLARIHVAVDLASEGDAEVAREALAEIADDLAELERLIADVLTAARLDLGDGSSPQGTPPLRRERVHVGDLLARAASRFRAAHPERTLELAVTDDLPTIDGDPVLLRRVIDNLLENAHKYTEHPTDPVELHARAGREIEIDVVDKGIGIAADDLPRVFRPFFRADRSRTRATGGLGLGLALAKRIVDAHGGSIELTSAPNEGTRARVRLPIASEMAEGDA